MTAVFDYGPLDDLSPDSRLHLHRDKQMSG